MDENKQLIERFDFEDTESIIGAQYKKNVNQVYFLLADTEKNIVDLCRFSVENKELKKIIKSIILKQNNRLEEPFKKIFFTTRNELFIMVNNHYFLKINLKNNSIKKIKLNKYHFDRYALIKNKIIYLKYIDENKTSYELKEYDFVTNQYKKILDGNNHYYKPVSLELFGDSNISSFFVQIDNRYFLYDYFSFKEIKIKASTILSYSEDYLIYLDFSNTVKAIYITK